ncbi:MAG: hypothetical protein ACLUTU_06520 [Blautia faecis]
MAMPQKISRGTLISQGKKEHSLVSLMKIDLRGILLMIVSIIETILIRKH